MNIFFLDWDPEVCAQYHVDKHVVKMILESCQLLYTCHWTALADGTPEYLASTPNGTGYKPTHRNHPCSIWLRESLDNYLWLLRLARALVDEYHFRYGDDKVHKCEEPLDWLSMVSPAGCPTSSSARIPWRRTGRTTSAPSRNSCSTENAQGQVSWGSIRDATEEEGKNSNACHRQGR